VRAATFLFAAFETGHAEAAPAGLIVNRSPIDKNYTGRQRGASTRKGAAVARIHLAAWPSHYFERSERLRATLAPHVVGLLQAGVVLDFHANTVAQDDGRVGLFEEAGASRQFHFLDVPDEVCRSRMHGRKAAGGNGVNDAEFDHATSFFVPPIRARTSTSSDTAMVSRTRPQWAEIFGRVALGRARL
jgi:hypothetical protein